MKPIISIVIPTYGRPNNLFRAAQSCLFQSFTNVEIVIVDDNCPLSAAGKETNKIVMELMNLDNRVRCVQHLNNKNGAAARNTGVYASEGKYIALLDDDDEFDKEKLSLQLDLLTKEGVDCVYCRTQKFKNGFYMYETKYNKFDERTVLLDIFLQRVELNSSTLLISKDVYLSLGGFDESFRRNQDYEFLVRFLEKFRLGCVDECLVKMHVDSKMNQLSAEDYALVRFDFIKKFSHVLDSFGMVKRLKVWRWFYFDLSVYFFRHGCFFKGTVFLCRSLPEPWIIMSHVSRCKGYFSKKFRVNRK